MNRIGIWAVAVILLVGFPSVAVPQAIAPSHPALIGGSVFGHVRSDLGSPLGGAIVVATSSNGEPQTTYTDNDGAYALKLDAGTWRLNVSARAHDGKAENVVVLASGVPVEKNFTLAHNGPAITGRVFDAKTGTGLAGATVEASPSGGYDCRADQPCPLMGAESGAVMSEFYRMPYTTQSGPDGKYAIAIDTNEKGMVSLRAWREGYRDTYQSFDVQGDVQQDLKLDPVPPKSAVLEGRVVDAKTGAPIAEAWVNAWPDYDREVAASEGSGGGSAGSSGSTAVAPSPTVVYPDGGCCYREGNSTQTDRDGRFRMGMHSGEYQFSVGANEYGQHMERLTLADGETRSVEVKLEPIPGDTVSVRGTVIDKATGRPVAGAWVSVENQQWGSYQGGQADESGRFDIKTKPGWTLVWVRVDGQGYAVPAQADAPASTEPATEPGSGMAIRPPEPDRPYIQPEGSYYPWVRSASFEDGQAVDWRVELQPKPKADIRLQGYVLDAETKKAIANAYVNIHNEDTGDWGWGQTDEYGSFVFLARPGMHTINANADGHFGNAVVVQVSAPATRVDIALQPGQQQGYCCVAYAKGGLAMAEDARATSGASGTAGSPAPPAAPQQQGSADAAAGSGQQAATYSATGESLGPYDPSKAPAPNTAQAANATPGFAPLLGLAALGAAALIAVRRRK